MGCKIWSSSAFNPWSIHLWWWNWYLGGFHLDSILGGSRCTSGTFLQKGTAACFLNNSSKPLMNIILASLNLYTNMEEWLLRIIVLIPISNILFLSHPLYFYINPICLIWTPCKYAVAIDLVWGQDHWILADNFFVWLWTETHLSFINLPKKTEANIQLSYLNEVGQYRSYYMAYRLPFFCGIQCTIWSLILPTWVANDNSTEFGSSHPLGELAIDTFGSPCDLFSCLVCLVSRNFKLLHDQEISKYCIFKPKQSISMNIYTNITLT